MRSWRRLSWTSICAHAFFVSFRPRTRPLYMPATISTRTMMNRKTPSPMKAKTAPVMLASLFVLRGTELAEEAHHRAAFASPGGGDQRLHLAPIEPESVPAGAPVDVHVVHPDHAHLSRTADAPPLALPAVARLRDHRVQPVWQVVPHPRELVD